MLSVDLATLALLGTAIPLLVGVVTKAKASSRIKAVVNATLSFLLGGVGYLVAHEGSAPWQEVAGAGLVAWTASGVAFHNLWKPLGTAEAVASATAGVGLGSDEPRKRRKRKAAEGS